jgi:hypothetical protein
MAWDLADRRRQPSVGQNLVRYGQFPASARRYVAYMPQPVGPNSIVVLLA